MNLRATSRALTVVGALACLSLAARFALQADSPILSREGLVAVPILVAFAGGPFVLAWKLLDRKPHNPFEYAAMMLAITFATVVAIVIYTRPESPNGRDGLEPIGVASWQGMILGGTALALEALDRVRRWRR